MRQCRTPRTRAIRCLLENLEPRLLLSITPAATYLYLSLPQVATTTPSGVLVTKFNNSSPATELAFTISSPCRRSFFLYEDNVLIPSTPVISGTDVTTLTTTGAALIPNGNHTFMVIQQFPGQDRSNPSPTITVQVNSALPDPPHAPVLLPQYDTGVSNSDGITNAFFGDLTFSADAGPFFYAYTNGVKDPTLYTAGSSFLLRITGAGEFAVTVSAVSADGKESGQSAPFLLNDTITPPARNPLAPTLVSDTGVSSSDNLTNDPTLHIDTQGASWFSVYELQLTGLVLVSDPFETGDTFTPPHLADGPHTFFVYTSDAAGNRSTLSPSLTLTLDTHRPAYVGVGDTAFAAVTRDALRPFSAVSTMLALPNGEILAGVSVAATGDAALIRLHTDGSLDTSFANQGILNLAIQGQPIDIAAQSSGNFLIALRTNTAHDIVRITPTGAIDTSFSSDGYFIYGGTLSSITVADNNDILAADGSGNVIRLTPAGLFDASFGTNGIAPAFDPNDAVNDITSDSLGRVLFSTTSPGSFSVVRLATDGSLDTSFATNGRYTLASADPLSIVSAQNILIDSFGNILFAACLNPADTLTNTSVLIRLTSSGILDTTFGTDGAAILPSYFATHVAPFSSGGYLVTDGNSNLYHVLSDGALDTHFLDAGAIPLLEHNHFTIGSFITRADGSIVLASSSGDNDFHLNHIVLSPDQLPPILLTPATDTGVLGDNVTTNTSPVVQLPGLAGAYYRISSGSTLLTDYQLNGNLALGTLSTGAHLFTIQYEDDAGNLLPGGSFSVTVQDPPPIPNSSTTTSLTSSVPSPVRGQSVTLTAAVSASSGSPAGTLIFTDGNRFLGAASLSNGSAHITLATLSLGLHHLQAFFISANSSFKNSSSASIPLTVAPDRPAYGLVNTRTASLIAGLALDPDSPGATYVRIDIDNKPTAVVATDAATHRFSYIPVHLSLGSHLVKVSVYNFPTPTLSLLANFSLVNHPPTTAIHSLTATTLSGSAADPDSPTTPVILIVQIDSRPAVMITANQTVTGLPAAHAFTYALPTLSAGTHHLILMTLDTSGAGITQHQALILKV